MHSILFIHWKSALIFVSLNLISLHRILWNCNLKCGMKRMRIGGTNRNRVSSSNTKSKSLNDAFGTFNSHFEWFITRPLLCEARLWPTDRTIPTVSIANWNYILYIKAYHQNQTQRNRINPSQHQSSQSNKKRHPVCMPWMWWYRVQCTMQMQFNAKQKVQLPHANIYALNLILFVVMFINSLFPHLWKLSK